MVEDHTENVISQIAERVTYTPENGVTTWDRYASASLAIGIIIASQPAKLSHLVGWEMVQLCHGHAKIEYWGYLSAAKTKVNYTYVISNAE